MYFRHLKFSWVKDYQITCLLNFMSVGPVALISSVLMSKSSRNTLVSSTGLYGSSLVHGAPNGIEVEAVYNFPYLAPLLRYHGLKFNVPKLDFNQRYLRNGGRPTKFVHEF